MPFLFDVLSRHNPILLLLLLLCLLRRCLIILLLLDKARSLLVLDALADFGNVIFGFFLVNIDLVLLLFELVGLILALLLPGIREFLDVATPLVDEGDDFGGDLLLNN